MGTRIRYVGDMFDLYDNGRVRVKDLGFSLSPTDLKSYEPFMNFLNQKDRDIVYLIFMSGKTQRSVGKIMGRDQALIVYDIHRIRERLRFICYLHSVFDIFTEFLENDACKYAPELVEVLVLMFYTTSFTAAARIVGARDYLKIRYKYDKIMIELERRKQWEIYEIFAAIRENLNTVKRHDTPRQPYGTA